MKNFCFAFHGNAFIVVTVFIRCLLIITVTASHDNVINNSASSLEYCDQQSWKMCKQKNSCASNGCGETLKQFTALETCSCDYLCPLYKDCCFDFENYCPHEIEKLNRSPLKKLVNITSKCLGPFMVLSGCVNDNPQQKEVVKNSENGPYQRGFNRNANYSSAGDAVNSTLNIHDDYNNEKEDIEGGDYFSPNNLVVTDLRTGLTYINEDVYHCNNPDVSNHTLVKWVKNYYADSVPTLEELQQFFTTGTSSDRFLKAVVDVPPESVNARLCQPEMAMKCMHNCSRYFTNVHDFCQIFNLFGEANPALLKVSYLETISTLSSDHFWGVFECYFISEFKPTPGIGYNEFIAFKALLNLRGNTKILQVDPLSGMFLGGWGQYSCVSESPLQPCQLKPSCDKNSFHTGDFCATPHAILITIQSKANDLGYAQTQDVFIDFTNHLRNQKTLEFGSLQNYEVSRGMMEVKKYTYISKLDISVEKTGRDAYENIYKTVIEKKFYMMNLSGKWNGTVTTCYDLQSHFYNTDTVESMISRVKDNNEQIICEDISFVKSIQGKENYVRQTNKTSRLISYTWGLAKLVITMNLIVLYHTRSNS